jgi:NADPH:quinone reductase
MAQGPQRSKATASGAPREARASKIYLLLKGDVSCAPAGRVCEAGWLGGLAPIEFNPLTQMPSGVQYSLFASFLFGTAEFPLTEVPLQTIVDRVAQGTYKAKPARVFRFEEIQEAHRLMESNQANGKIVVVV